jgi:hypothetical protein
MSSGKVILRGSSMNSTSTRNRRRETDSLTPPRPTVENPREAREVLPVPNVLLEPRKTAHLLPQLRRGRPMKKVEK